MGNTLNNFNEFAGPKHNAHCYIKVVVRNFNDWCKYTMGELLPTVQCIGNEPASMGYQKYGASHSNNPKVESC